MAKIQDPGFGYHSYKNAQSVFKEDGTPNIIHVNRARTIDDLYAYLIGISWMHFFGLVLLMYTLLNIVFAFIYVGIGIEQITPSTGSIWHDILNGFFFSAQTVTTVGYGGIAPQGMLANLIAAFEAMIGLLSFSFITGLLYGRFSKPRAAIKFSKHFVIRDFNGTKALMFRLMNNRKTVMIEPEITVMLSITAPDETGTFKRSFFRLDLERDKIMYLPTIWTVVHTIDEESPLYTYEETNLQELDAELYVLLKYHEESFAQQVYKIHSYKFDTLQKDIQFVPSFEYDDEGFTLLDHDKLDKMIPM